jgi:hypothetical protein
MALLLDEEFPKQLADASRNVANSIQANDVLVVCNWCSSRRKDSNVAFWLALQW